MATTARARMAVNRSLARVTPDHQHVDHRMGVGANICHWTTPFDPVPQQHSHPHIMTSTVVFPAHATDQMESMSSVSVLSRQATALEICDMVYGNKTPSWEAIEHYYEPSASEPSVSAPTL